MGVPGLRRAVLGKAMPLLRAEGSQGLVTRSEAYAAIREMRRARGGRMADVTTVEKVALVAKDRHGLRPIALTNGVFGGRGLTPGQAWSLAHAHAKGCCPIVLLASDRVAAELKTYPVAPFESRMIAVAAAMSDGFVCEWDELRVTEAIRLLRPACWVKGGGDWTLETLDAGEREAAEEVGAEIVLLPELALPHVSELRGESEPCL